MKKILLFSIITLFTLTAAMAQGCKVLPETLTGTYTGECKSDKANGKGKAVGTDTYEGEFKAGYPEGKGIYTFQNKDWFEGIFKKGLREGDGTLHITEGGTKDSSIVGFWKKDKYAGRYEKAYKILSQSVTVSNVNVSENVGSSVHEIAILLSGQVTKTSNGQRLSLTAIDITKGEYASYGEVPYQPKVSKFLIKKVSFPFIAHFRSDTHFVEIAFYEEGSYIVNVDILQ